MSILNCTHATCTYISMYKCVPGRYTRGRDPLLFRRGRLRRAALCAECDPPAPITVFSQSCINAGIGPQFSLVEFARIRKPELAEFTPRRYRSESRGSPRTTGMLRGSLETEDRVRRLKRKRKIELRLEIRTNGPARRGLYASRVSRECN
ncbi:hypothetical protein X777_01936 [Ooceraea biroi]|uniref:Uncharacterized protein n=1 Tax=Ooceraea biroi TaxID=2015173 RepID=A0A026WPE0_OOCBI|nr:hypothetical protein X777_01936 [Ooceraea biroi]